MRDSDALAIAILAFAAAFGLMIYIVGYGFLGAQAAEYFPVAGAMSLPISCAMLVTKLDKQRLLLVLPVPTKLPLAAAVVLLSNGDAKVYQYVMTHGGKKVDQSEDKTRVKYAGNPIYDSKCRSFAINGWNYRSDTITVYEN